MPIGDPADYRVYNPPSFQRAQTIDVPPAVAGILMTLPIPGTPWRDVEKAQFLAALGAVLDLCYPTPDSAGEKHGD